MNTSEQNEAKNIPQNEVKNRFINFICKNISLQYILKFSITLLFIVLLCSTICLLLNNVCNFKCRDNYSSIDNLQNKIQNDTLTQVFYNTKEDSLIKTNFLINRINDTLFSVKIKNDATYSNNITSEIKKADSNQENLIKIVTILLAVFTAIFGIFTFLAQNSLNRAEKIKDDIDEQRQRISDENDKFKKEIENRISTNNKNIKVEFDNKTSENNENLRKIMDERFNEFKENEIIIQEKAQRSQENSEKLLNNASELLNRNIEENKRYRELWLLIANQFLPQDIRPSATNLQDIIDLWNSDRAKFAAYNLAARGDKKCLLFLRDRYKFFDIKNDDESKRIAVSIKEAIAEIEKLKT